MEEILPLIVFTTCGGIAAGAYVMSALGLLCGEKTAEADKRAWLFPLVCIVLLGVGLLATLMHLGQPLRFVNGMANPASMISQESYWAIAFGVVMVIDLLVTKLKGQSAVVRWVGALVGFGLMIVTGLAYYDCVFLPAWATAVTIPLFVVGDLLMGAGLVLLFERAEMPRTLHAFTVMAALAWVAVAAGYVVYLMGLGLDTGLVFASIVVALGAGAVSACMLAGKMPAKTAKIAVLVLAVVAVVLARWAFFAGGVL